VAWTVRSITLVWEFSRSAIVTQGRNSVKKGWGIHPTEVSTVKMLVLFTPGGGRIHPHHRPSACQKLDLGAHNLSDLMSQAYALTPETIDRIQS